MSRPEMFDLEEWSCAMYGPWAVTAWLLLLLPIVPNAYWNDPVGGFLLIPFIWLPMAICNGLLCVAVIKLFLADHRLRWRCLMVGSLGDLLLLAVYLFKFMQPISS